jgi:hypothetical protein
VQHLALMTQCVLSAQHTVHVTLHLAGWVHEHGRCFDTKQLSALSHYMLPFGLFI